ncbi:hypothetical protein ACHAXR_009005 [Thalassiosira sp. AJA248-18]
MNNPQPRQAGQQQQNEQQPPEDENNNKITPELLVDALSGHEDGLLSIAERLMTHYDAGYDAMGEAIIDAFADVQKLFQHVVEAAHMEGAALERERGEGEWRKRMENLGMDADGILYGNLNETLDGTGVGTGVGGGLNSSRDVSGEDGNNNNRSSLTPTKSEEHRHEELIDQDVRDVLIDAIKRGQSHRDAQRFTECRSLYESSCASASALLPVDSDHRGRLQLAVARAESMSADRACAILKYAMDDVLRSGLTLRQGKYPQMDINERSDCVLSRPNPLRTTPSRGYDIGGGSSWSDGHHNIHSSRGGGGGMDGSTSSIVEQSAEEALNSLVEEMKEIVGAPVYNLTPLQNVSEKFWLALGEAKKSTAKKEERLEQALAKIKGDFLLAREEYEEQLSEERERVEGLKRRFNELRVHGDHSSRDGHSHHSQDQGSSAQDALHVPYTPNRPRSAASSGGSGNNALSAGGGNNNNHQQHLHSYQFHGMDDTTTTNESQSSLHKHRMKNSSNQSVVSLGSEFAQKAKSLVHLLNCQGKEFGKEQQQPSTVRYNNGGNNVERDEYGRGGVEGGSPR